MNSSVIILMRTFFGLPLKISFIIVINEKKLYLVRTAHIQIEILIV